VSVCVCIPPSRDDATPDPMAGDVDDVAICAPTSPPVSGDPRRLGE